MAGPNRELTRGLQWPWGHSRPASTSRVAPVAEKGEDLRPQLPSSPLLQVQWTLNGKRY